MVVRVRGREPLLFLDATTTQALRELSPGRGALTCLLDETGHVLSEMRVLPLRDGSVLLDGEPAAREALTGWLARVAPLSGCEILDESSSWHAATLRNVPPPPDLPDDEHAFVERDDEIVARVRWGGPGHDVLARGPAAATGARDEAAFETARIEAGRTRYGIDVTRELILNETPLLHHAVSFTKGCYPGQETVAKIRNLGRARRLLIGLRADGPIKAGARVLDGEAEVGHVTSAAGPVAIALVRAESATSLALSAGGLPVRPRALE